MNPKLVLSDSPESKALLGRYRAIVVALGHKLHDPAFQVPTGVGSRTINRGKVEASAPVWGISDGLRRAVVRDTADEALRGLVESLGRDLLARVRLMRSQATDLVAQAEDLNRKADAAEKVLRGES